jgi:hypothetical protein
VKEVRKTKESSIRIVRNRTLQKTKRNQPEHTCQNQQAAASASFNTRDKKCRVFEGFFFSKWPMGMQEALYLSEWHSSQKQSG